MSYPGRIGVSAHDLVTVVVTEDDRPGRPRGIDRRNDRAIAIAIVTVGKPIETDIIARGLVRAIDLVSQSSGGVWHRELGNDSSDTEESRLHSTGRNIRSREIGRASCRERV